MCENELVKQIYTLGPVFLDRFHLVIMPGKYKSYEAVELSASEQL